MKLIDSALFWVPLALMLLLALWLMLGSPTDTETIIVLVVFVAGSELALWRSHFEFDKKASVGFAKVNKDIEDIKDKLDSITKALEKK